MKTNLANFLKLAYRKAAKRAKAANHCKIALQKQNTKAHQDYFSQLLGETD